MCSIIPFIPPAITLIGAVLVWVYSPGHLTVIDGGTWDNAPARPKAGTKRKNTLLRLGLVLEKKTATHVKPIEKCCIFDG